jgi:hypothetical protein
MTETERRIDAVMIALSALRRSGIIRPDAAVSPATMAYVSEQIGEPVSKATFHRTTRRALTLARLALTTISTSSTDH